MIEEEWSSCHVNAHLSTKPPKYLCEVDEDVMENDSVARREPRVVLRGTFDPSESQKQFRPQTFELSVPLT